MIPKPSWLKVRAPGGDEYHRLKQTLRELALHTVCEEARCPNVGECWRAGTATVMLLGERCTRGCRFCAVARSNPRGAVDQTEPRRVAEAISKIRLAYVVLTMVSRDDLPDGGAEHVAETIRSVKELSTTTHVEALVSDFQGAEPSIDTVLSARPDVFGHNVEVVRSLTPILRDSRSCYDRSIEVLSHAKSRAPAIITKSSLLVGVGETAAEVLETLRDLRAASVDVVTIGQYLQPTPQHHEVVQFIAPEQFDDYRRAALEMGFAYVASGPLVRSSYRAVEGFIRALRHPVSA